MSRSDAQILVTSPAGETQVAAFKHGSGQIVVCCSADVFSNAAMLNEAQAELAVRLVQTAHQHHRVTSPTTQPIPIVVSEFLNVSNAWRGTSVLMSPELRSGTLQLITIAVLVGWYGFHRFGPPQHVQRTQRRSLSESAVAVGDLQFRTNSGDEAVRQYLEYFRIQLQQRFGSSMRLDDFNSVAARTGLNADAVKQHIEFATAVAEDSRYNTSEAAKAIRQLAEILR